MLVAGLHPLEELVPVLQVTEVLLLAARAPCAAGIHAAHKTRLLLQLLGSLSDEVDQTNGAQLSRSVNCSKKRILRN